MDNYPEYLAPDFDDYGAVTTPFEEWWPHVQSNFPTVPEEVAKEWLHRHWSHSPYEWIPSKQYEFELVDWPSNKLDRIRSCLATTGHDKSIAHGKFLIEDHKLSWLSRYMNEHNDTPTPIIVLDNRDGHLIPGVDTTPSYAHMPTAFVLMEGHLRFNSLSYLGSIGRLRETVKVWLMKRRDQ